MSGNLLAYVEAARQVARTEAEKGELPPSVTEWLDWAESYAKAQDSLARPLAELAVERVQPPNPYAFHHTSDYVKPPTPFWFNRNR